MRILIVDDKDENLYFRDSNYFTRKEANGTKVFWGRGNGWVFAGLPIIIRELPSEYENKDYFVAIYKQMAAKNSENKEFSQYQPSKPQITHKHSDRTPKSL